MDELIRSALMQALCYGLVWLPWRFRMRNATVPWPAGLTVFFGFFSMVLMVAALMSAGGYRNWARLSRLPELRSLAAMAAAGNQREALLVGRASADCTTEWEPDEAPVWTSGDLDLILDDGTADLDRTGGARRIGWHTSDSTVSRSREWISTGEPLVVAATVQHWTGLTGATRGQRLVSGVAEVIFRGTPKGFRSLAEERSRSLPPRLGAWTALLGAALTAGLPLARLPPPAQRHRGAPGFRPNPARAVGVERGSPAWLGWLDATDRSDGSRRRGRNGLDRAASGRGRGESDSSRRRREPKPSTHDAISGSRSRVGSPSRRAGRRPSGG